MPITPVSPGMCQVATTTYVQVDDALGLDSHLSHLSCALGCVGGGGGGGERGRGEGGEMAFMSPPQTRNT